MTDFHNERAHLAELEGLLRQGKLDEAVALGSDLVEQYPESFLIRLHLARALKENNNLLRAETVLSAIGNRYGDNITFLIERGDLLRRLGRLEEAEQDYQKILFLDPFNSRIKTALEEIRSDQETASEAAFEVVDYSGEGFRDDQTVPELIVKEHEEPAEISYEPVLDLDAEPENEQFFNPVKSESADEEDDLRLFDESPETGATELSLPEVESKDTDDLEKPDDGWIQVDISPPQEAEAPEAPATLSNHEAGFVTESAARLYAQQGLYREALSIYERLGQLGSPDKYRQQIGKIKRRIVAERQLHYFQNMLTHFNGERGSYLV